MTGPYFAGRPLCEEFHKVGSKRIPANGRGSGRRSTMTIIRRFRRIARGHRVDLSSPPTPGPIVTRGEPALEGSAPREWPRCVSISEAGGPRSWMGRGADRYPDHARVPGPPCGRSEVPRGPTGRPGERHPSRWTRREPGKEWGRGSTIGVPVPEPTDSGPGSAGPRRASLPWSGRPWPRPSSVRRGDAGRGSHSRARGASWLAWPDLSRSRPWRRPGHAS